MAVPTLITDLSTTAASNAPAGSDSPSIADNVMRAHAAFIAQLRDRDSAFALTLLDDADAAAARATLVAAKSGANADITSITGLTTPLTIAQGGSGSATAFASSLGTNGYQKLPSGLIIQWGNATTDASGDATVTLPIAFPTANLNVVATYTNPTKEDVTVTARNLSVTQIIVGTINAGVNTSAPVFWIAIGY